MCVCVCVCKQHLAIFQHKFETLTRTSIASVPTLVSAKLRWKTLFVLFVLVANAAPCDVVAGTKLRLKTINVHSRIGYGNVTFL